jgi:hypothetical protein
MEESRTNSEPKIVPSSLMAEQVVRAFLADTLNFLRGRRAWPDVDGDLSDWIIRMHGVHTANPSDDLSSTDFPKIIAGLDRLCAALQRMPHANGIRRQLEQMGKEENPKILEAQQSGNKEALDAVVSQLIRRMMKAVEIPESFPMEIDLISYAGFVRLLRATRATLVSMALFHEHPLSLIARAFKGDREATLDLIKVDHMFVNDRCCKETIRKAALQDDDDFIAQVQRALKYKRRIHRRELLHFYLFNLLLFEQLGIALPPINELWTRLDPSGNEYKTLQAFEKDVQRRRDDFEQIVESGALAAKSLMAIQIDSAGPQA